MKKIMISFCLLLAGSAACLAQCGKKYTLISSKTIYTDGKGVVTRTKDENTIVEISKSDIFIAPGQDEEHFLRGTIKSSTCDWQKPFKEGKTVIKTVVTNPNGEMNATITIEGKDGKVTLTFELAEMPEMKIQIVADKFEEKTS